MPRCRDWSRRQGWSGERLREARATLPRRLLAWYPRAFRQEHEQEILGVLMAGADEDQQGPRPGEAANLLKYALWMRLGLSQGEDMASETMFPMKVDRPSRVLVAGLGAGRKAPRVTASSATVDVRMGWGFSRHACSRGCRVCPPLGRWTGRAAGPAAAQRSARCQLLARHRSRQWRGHRPGRDHTAQAKLGSAGAVPGSDASLDREC